MQSNNNESNIFLNEYLSDLSGLIKPDKVIVENLVRVSNIIKNTSQNGKKTLIFGNGGSSAIASHFSVDLTKNSGIKCVNFNEYDLITCFSNDFGYENWIFKAVEYYGDKGDLLILISSSGMSKNIINGCKIARKKKMKIVTLSGFQKTNLLNKKGDINIWINSKVYNIVENIHQIILE